MRRVPPSQTESDFATHDKAAGLPPTSSSNSCSPWACCGGCPDWLLRVQGNVCRSPGLWPLLIRVEIRECTELPVADRRTRCARSGHCEKLQTPNQRLAQNPY